LKYTCRARCRPGGEGPCGKRRKRKFLLNGALCRHSPPAAPTQPVRSPIPREVRSGTLVYSVTSREAPAFLRKKNCAKCHNENGLTLKRAHLSFDGEAKETPLNIQEHNIQDTVARFIKKDEVLIVEVLPFREATDIEFKECSAKSSLLIHQKKSLPKYISAFTKTEGGYLFFGVDDNTKVTGTHSNIKKVALEQTVADAVSSMCAHHFCGSGAGVQIQMHILGVYDQAGCSQGYACAMHIELSCCSVSDGDPQSWMVLSTVREES
ncbi:schlafen family member 12-like, partial [Motacilla alba alba]|uniref:schlafen family member 12-like n=1 Tax=Motacilla alba alba TaxID=1094192 RepID=UPI0018D56720